MIQFKADRTIFPSFSAIFKRAAGGSLLHEKDIITLQQKRIIAQTSPGNGAHDQKQSNQ
jgi:hypothetical protein